MHNDLTLDNLRDFSIGTIDYVSPMEWKVLLDLDAPQNTAINTGVPTLFPKINGFVLIPCEDGALVGMISWIGIEHSQYPIRKGFKDFDLIDLPYPLRKMAVNPLGLLKNTKDGLKIERGVYNYPSVGDIVTLPTQEQLQAIVENKDEKAHVNIGVSPVAANAPVFVNPDKLFGRHIAILGNTGSGKSCSVAGLIRWSIESAREEMKSEEHKDSNLNARFLILDPNGEYSESFDDDLECTIRKFRVKLDDEKDGVRKLRVPVWMWNSYEWSAITSASGKTQRPLLRRTLRELRGGKTDGSDDEKIIIRRYFSSSLISLRNAEKNGPATYAGFPGKQNFGELISTIRGDTIQYIANSQDESVKFVLESIKTAIEQVLSKRPKKGDYFSAFMLEDIIAITSSIASLSDAVGSLGIYEGPDEDSPVPFDGEQLPNHLERLSQEQNVQQFLDFFIMRIRTMLADARMSSIIGTDDSPTLTEWLEEYVGANNAENGEIALFDLSLVPTDVIHLVIAVIARIVFESLQRYRRLNQKVLPTVMVLEEAHTFIKKYSQDNEEISPQMMCCQTFERIAREGRKFGLGLLLSSQRPSELSPTVLSQCNTFLLHRLVNDRDQELVRKLVPDNLGNLLSELPVLPTRKAILLGWASPIPLLVEMKWLKSKHRPKSSDPDFWNVWTKKEPREIDWKQIVDEWQKNWSKIDKEKSKQKAKKNKK